MLSRLTPGTPAVATALYCALCASATAGAAEVQKKNFNLPAGDAAATLKQFAAESGQQIVYLVDNVRGEKTNPVTGEFAPHEALDRMLAGTLLVATQDPNTGALVVGRRRTDSSDSRSNPAAKPPPKSASTPTPMKSKSLLAWFGSALALVSPNADAQRAPADTDAKKEEIVALTPFQVSGAGDRGYGVTNSIGASRIALPLEDISTAVSTLNRNFQDDIGAVNIVEAIRYVSGVDMAAPLAEQWSQRGTGTNTSMMDGVPDPAVGGGNRERYDPMLTERIEVIKGPVGTLYGAHSGGGLVNRVSKFPLPVRRTELALSVGSYDQKRVDFDTTGPVGDKGRLYYRLIGYIRDGEYSYKGSTYDGKMISPMLSLALGQRSKTWARFVYRSEQRPTEGTQNWFLDAGNHVSYFIPRERALDNPDSTFRTMFNGYEVGADSVFNTGKIEWATRVVGRYNSTGGDSLQYTKPTYRFINAAGQVIGTQTNTLFSDPRWVTIDYTRNRRERGDERHAYVYDWDLSAKFDVGPTKHWGFTYYQGGRDELVIFNRVYPYAPSNIDRPVYFANGRDGIIGPISSNANSKTLNRWYAWGAHDNVFLLDRHIVLAAGARFDHVESTGTNLVNGSVTKAENEQWSHKYGIIGKPVRGVSLFYNISQTFTPENRIDPITRDKFPNQISEIHEGGVKLDLLENRLTGTFTNFKTEQNNVVVTVHDPVTGFSVLQAVGRQIVRGWEGDFNYQPVDGLNLKLGIGSIDRAANEAGLRPRWVGIGMNYKFFGKYSFRRGPLKGLGFGAGVVYTNDAAGDATDTFTLPGYALYDGLVQYARDRWSVQLNIYNLTDKVYAITAVDRTLIYSGQPRNFRLTWRYKL